MSNIDKQIAALQLKKKKIDYVSYVAELVKGDTKCVDYKDVQKEIVDQLEPFLLKLMESIENDSKVEIGAVTSHFTEQEITTLKLLANRAVAKQQAPAQPNQAFGQDVTTNNTPPPPKKQNNTQDKMSFALDNRHLADKRVQVINDQNVQVFGKVVGLDAPFVVVKTETGPTIQVPLEKIVPV